MAKISRFLFKQFGIDGTTTDFGKFGSLAAGAAATTKNPATIQSLQEYLDGWKEAVIATNRPALEDRNSLDFLFGQAIAYLYQDGIADWETGTEYHQFSIVRETGTYELYGSLINTNSGNALPSQVDDTNWKYLGNLSDLVNASSRFMVGQRVELDYEPSAGDLTANRLLHSDGSAVSRATYAALFAKIGVIHGQGDGATTFNLPDWRGRFPRGWDDGAGVDPDSGSRVTDATGGDAGDNVGSVQDDALESHLHNVVVSLGGSGTPGTVYPDTTGVEGDDSILTDNTGGNETRPVNKYAWVGIAY